MSPGGWRFLRFGTKVTATLILILEVLNDQQVVAKGSETWIFNPAGHKKDLVLTNRLWQVPDRVAIYGWHRDVDRPIQPLSTVHGARYADYSHGVRLVSDTVYINGRKRPIDEVLGEPALAHLVEPLFPEAWFPVAPHSLATAVT